MWWYDDESADGCGQDKQLPNPQAREIWKDMLNLTYYFPHALQVALGVPPVLFLSSVFSGCWSVGRRMPERTAGALTGGIPCQRPKTASEGTGGTSSNLQLNLLPELIGVSTSDRIHNLFQKPIHLLRRTSDKRRRFQNLR